MQWTIMQEFPLPRLMEIPELTFTLFDLRTLKAPQKDTSKLVASDLQAESVEGVKNTLGIVFYTWPIDYLTGFTVP